MNAADQSHVLSLGQHRFHLQRPLIMAVLNLTPDSFSDGGHYLNPQAAIERAQGLIAQGADVLDLGAESTRPGAVPVPASVQLGRLIPVIQSLDLNAVAVSVDTSDAVVMTEVLAAGVHMINDVNALRAQGAVEAVAATSAAVCLMHMKGNPLTMQGSPVYRAVVLEVADFLHSRCNCLRAAGIGNNRIVVDPGIGFGKTLEHNLALLRAIGELKSRCGLPVLIGISRKSMLAQVTGRQLDDRLAASLGAALGAVSQGANLLRVHDVQATRDALDLWQAIAASKKIE